MRILLVDDDRAVHMIVEAAFRGRHDVVLEHAHDGAEAVARVRAGAPDIVLLDHVMPGMEGPEVLQELHRDPGPDATVVIFLTARAGPDVEKQLVEAGAAGVITKPFRVDELAGQVARLAAGAAGRGS